MKRNDIVELADWFDYKYDYLITFDLESILKKIIETKSDKLQFVMKDILVSASIVSNVPGLRL